MKRKAILIEASEITGQEDLPGARADVERLTQFLVSDLGGAWHEKNEIRALHTPSLQQLEEALREADNADYAFVSFSGHGQHLVSEDGDEEETVVAVHKQELELPARCLVPSSPRTLVVVDACRGIEVVEKALMKRAVLEDLRGLDLRRRQRCRAIFDQQVQRAEKGQIVMFSCGLNEAAGESPNGGTFTTSLVLCSEAWEAQVHGKGGNHLDTRGAFACAQRRTRRSVPQQNPEIWPGRRRRHFPFAVSV